jgi:hypothetical protein
MLKRILGHERANVTAGWRPLHSEELLVIFTKYFYGNQTTEGHDRVTNIPASYSGGPVSNLSLDTSYID